MKNYDHRKIESKWQREWENKKIYQAKDFSKKPKFFSLIEFPYPSGDGLHVGHPRPYIGMDVISRKRRMEGYNVLYPIGWDAFGLPTENYAIKTGLDPRVVTKKNSDTFRRQIKSLGISFDWSREINTTDPKYYKWTQWIFLQFFKKGLAYKKKMEINWCPSCKIGLANEEVIAGACERCGTAVEKREKEQWMLAITKYAERLDKDLDEVDYLPQIKLAQRNWIGQSEGAEIEFKIKNLAPDLPPTPSQGRGALPGYITTNAKEYKELYEKALEMRKNSTQAEKILWEALKANKKKYHFRRQHIIDHFIVDFLCLSKNLIIEIEGDVHDYQKERDAERTNRLEALGYTVLEFRNEEVLENLGDVIKKISKKLETLPDYPLSSGEGWGEVGLNSVKVFTTRPDTIFGATYLVLAPEHELISKLKSTISNWDEVLRYILVNKKRTDLERTAENKEKTGVELKGEKAINPATKEEISVWIADYVLPQYGTGAIMAVPAHDERDFEFAKKYNLPVRQVIAPHLVDKNNPPQVGKRYAPRVAVQGVVKHWIKDEFIQIKWKGFPWNTFVIGGAEEGEDLKVAVKREVQEETGYKNIKSVIQITPETRSEWYADHKDENRYAHMNIFLVELGGPERDEMTEEEKSKHEVAWVPRSSIPTFSPVGEIDYIVAGLNNADLVYTGDGIIINSGEFSEKQNKDALGQIIKFVGGKEKTTFKLRDWVFSRQRYWGEPIPVVFCLSEGSPCSNTWVPVPEKDLPVELPKVKNYQPTDSGESPLANIAKWVNTKCPKCKGPAKRETDTMPNWAGSSWYYLRYTDPKNSRAFADKKKLKYWLGPTPNPFPRKGRESPLSFGEGEGGVNWYNGGYEHTTLHLLYSRFWHKFLFDLGLVPTNEPYKKRTSHGIILAEGGEKMSKSRGNVVNPDDIVKRFGADTLRLYEMFMGPFDQAIAWSEEAIVGPRRFLEKVWHMSYKVKSNKVDQEKKLETLLHQTIKKVTEDIESMRFNTAISSLMIFANAVEKSGFQLSIFNFKNFLKILSPFAPHITEELWARLGEKKNISQSEWPKWDKNKIEDEEIKIVIQVNGKVRGEMMVPKDEEDNAIKQKAEESQVAQKYLAGQSAKKIIYVKNRLINIVT